MSYNASVVYGDPNIQHIQTKIYYDRVAIENLKAHLATYPCFERKSIPMREGKTMQFHSISKRSVINTTPVAEGTSGAPLPHAGSVKDTVTLQQYADYITFSDFVVETSYTPIVEEQAVELSYAAARVVDTLNYNEMDTAAAADAAAQVDLAGNASPEYFSASVARRIRASLEAQDVMPKEGNLFAGIMHPLVAFDYVTDNTAGGVLDILKFNPSMGNLKSGVFASQDAPFIMDGIRWIRSTVVPTTANYDSGSATAYHGYVIGKNAFFCASLGSFAKVPQDRNFRVRTVNFDGTTPDNVAGLIKSGISYNFKYATYIPPDSISRFRRFRCEVSVT